MKINIYHPCKPMAITYHFVDTTFGRALVAQCEQGICEILFTEGVDEDAVADLHLRWPDAKIIEECRQNDITQSASAKKTTHETDDTQNTYFDRLALDSSNSLYMRGTPLQIKVWSVLTDIPYGTTVTYSEVANIIGRPKAVRAVASAIASNKIAILIPCHRVIRSDGNISGYRWGCDRKRLIIDWEKSHTK